jgi:signal transduction histidine kinase
MNPEADILIVEDSPTQAVLLQGLFERCGHRVSVARNGREALSFLKEHKPTLVISDILMPEMDGWELCRQIKADAYLKDISVVLLTTLSDPEDVVRALEFGADNFFTKPYDEHYLLARIQNIIKNLELRRTGEMQEDEVILLGGQKHRVTAERQQILDILLSVYETAVQKNRELIKTHSELRELNEQLEAKVQERTAALAAEIAERKRVAEALQAKSEEIRTMTQQLWQTAKLATMGELTASIAHELNNPLQTISLHVESLLAQMPSDAQQGEALRVIERELERMANLVTNLLQSSRHQGQRISTITVTEEIEKTLELVYYYLRKRAVKFVREFAADIPPIQADREHLRQVFVNLFTNAADAMPQGGTLTVRVVPGRGGAREREEAGADRADSVVVEVTDTGTGISAEELPKVMQPFYTTKKEGQGTGLGLPICRRIMEAHRGTLEIESEAGKGTTVRLVLPIGGCGRNSKELV